MLPLLHRDSASFLAHGRRRAAAINAGARCDVGRVGGGHGCAGIHQPWAVARGIRVDAAPVGSREEARQMGLMLRSNAMGS